MPNMNALSLRIKKLWPMLKFLKRVKGHSQGHTLKVMANVKVFEKKVKGHSQGHTLKTYGTMGKASS